jgi:hypothetical protein
VELRGFEPLTPCMPCRPHQFTTPCVALPSTASALVMEFAGRRAVVGREATCGIAADSLLTGRALDCVREPGAIVPAVLDHQRLAPQVHSFLGAC